MLYSILCFVFEVVPQIAVSITVAIITSFGVAISFAATRISYKKMRQEHEEKMATKGDVKVIDNKMSAYIDSHKELHKKEGERINDMHRMLCVIYEKMK